MSFFRAPADIIGGVIEHVAFKNPMSLQMNHKRITETGDPIEAEDAVNHRTMQRYVTDLIFALETRLDDSGLPGLIDNRLFGIVHVLVSGTEEGMPLGIFFLSKISKIELGTVTVVSSREGSSGATIHLTWPPNSGIFIKKDGNGNRGTYKIKFI